MRVQVQQLLTQVDQLTDDRESLDKQVRISLVLQRDIMLMCCQG